MTTTSLNRSNSLTTTMGSGLVAQKVEKKASLTDKILRAKHPKPHTPSVIIVEGNIGAGKSTVLDLIQTLSSDVIVMQEPVDVWTKLPGPDGKDINMLELFYEDTAKFAMLFQVLVQSTYARAFVKAYEMAEQSKARYLVIERSFAASHQIFAAVIRQKKSMSAAEFAVLEHSMQTAELINPRLFTCDHLLYLKCPAEMCMNRKILRSRPEEMAAVTIGYLLQLEEAYERWFARGFSPLSAKKTTIINTDCTLPALKDSLQNAIRL